MFSINKLNLKFIKTSQYFSDFNLIVKHKSEKFNIISDILFKLLKTNIIIRTDDWIKVLKTFYETFIDVCHDNLHIMTIIFLLSKQTFVYYIILMKMTNYFKQKLKQAYIENRYWNKILVMLKTNQTFKINQIIIQVNDSINQIKKNII